MNLTQDLREALSLAKTQQAEIVRLLALVDEARELIGDAIDSDTADWCRARNKWLDKVAP